MMVHGAWAAAALVAFGIGRLGRDERSAGGDGGTETGGHAAARSGGAAGMAGPAAGRLATKSGVRVARDGRAGTDGELGKLFGSISSAAGVDALAEQAVRDPNPVNRRLAFARLLESLTAENAPAIREQLLALGADEDQWRDFHYSWGALAGEPAFLHAVASEERDMEATLTGWAAADPTAALGLLDRLPENLRNQRERIAASIVAGIADHDRRLATEVALGLAGEGGRMGEHLIGIVAGETLRATGPQEAAQWAEALPDGPLKGAAMSQIAAQYVRRDAAGAAQWAARYAANDFAAPAVERVGTGWARSDPQAAVDWLAGLPAGSGQAAGLRGAFGDWEDRDPAAATTRLGAMQPSPQRDAAISGFSSGYAWQDPQVAIDWAQQISDSALRQQTLTRVGQAYFNRNPDAARAWLPTSGLPPAAQQTVLTQRR